MRNYWRRIEEARLEDPRWNSVHFLSQVHDEILCEGEEGVCHEAYQELKKTMEEADSGRMPVPLTAGGGVGKSWVDAH